MIVVVVVAVTTADIVANAIIVVDVIALAGVIQTGDIYHHPCRLKILSNS